MAQLGFIGLGIMGMPMARNLIKGGHKVAVWSHTRSKIEDIARENGAIGCPSPKAVAEAADCVFYCVGNSEMSREVATGPNGLIEGVRPGAVIADCSTIDPRVSVEIGKAFAARGAHFLDAPCTGSKLGAENGTLTFMIGGDQDVFARVRPYFELMGKQFYFCGGPGMGLQAKLSQNLILANMLCAFNEGIVLSTKAGVSPDVMLDILNNSAAKSGLISFKAPYILGRDFTTHFSTKWMHKDVGMALEAGKTFNVPLPLTALTHQIFQAGLAMGYGEDDMCSIIKVLENIAGVEVKKS